MSKVLPPLTINGTRYSVLRLSDAKRGPRYLLRSEAGDLFGLFAQNAALPMVMERQESNELERVNFFETERGLVATK